MSALPTPEQTTAQAILRWWEQNAETGHRPHLGASLIGHACERALWLTFRWAEAQKFEGRMLRLFDDGKRAEPRFVQELRGIGCKVWEHDEQGKQFGVSALGGHFGGSVDAVVQGLVEASKAPHVAEFKTSNEKAFKALAKSGVKHSKPLHFAQMQTYMGLMNIDRALYMVENKNDASIYTERVQFDAAEFDRIFAKATRVINAAEPPARIAESADDTECKFCHFKDLCHGEKAPEVNCRTCTHSTPRLDGDALWQCEKYDCALPVDNQRQGCADHRYIPILLERMGKVTGVDGSLVLYRMDDGTEFANGEPPDGFTSEEIRAAGGTTMLRDRQVRELREEFPDARIVKSTAHGTVFDDMDSDIPY